MPEGVTAQNEVEAVVFDWIDGGHFDTLILSLGVPVSAELRKSTLDQIIKFEFPEYRDSQGLTGTHRA